MPRSKQQNEAMRAATKTAVINSAMKLFAQNGYAHTTTRRIAREANVSTGLMYHYFDSKESLLRAVFDNCMAIINEAFNAAYGQAAPEDGLADLLKGMFALLQSDPSFWALFYMLRTQPAITRELGDDFRLWTKRLRDLFVAELQQTERTEPELEAFLLYSLIEGTIQQYLLDPDNYPLDRVVEQIIARYADPTTGG